LGLLVGILYVQMSWAAVLFLLMPLLVARHGFRTAIEMAGSYDATVRQLISVFETKDPYTRGHAERVSRLAELTARSYGLPEADCIAIRYSALMHDIGKLTVRSGVLKKPGKLTAPEYEHMQLHPERGVEILSEIDLLKDQLDGVRYHHEKMDGTGYPDGLIGHEIPLFARLIMVADAFDSMTSTRSYRRSKSIEDAMQELRRCEGTQFDPVALEALERAVQRYGWEPVPEIDEEEHHHEDSGHHHARLASL
ncbi:MAG TPA: HD-GYP domain-containing protein, partial [Actinomycetota bacterium]|nr:HD-GYP domain-containing protein [Actinomycetota bacterium]